MDNSIAADDAVVIVDSRKRTIPARNKAGVSSFAELTCTTTITSDASTSSTSSEHSMTEARTPPHSIISQYNNRTVNGEAARMPACSPGGGERKRLHALNAAAPSPLRSRPLASLSSLCNVAPPPPKRALKHEYTDGDDYSTAAANTSEMSTPSAPMPTLGRLQTPTSSPSPHRKQQKQQQKQQELQEKRNDRYTSNDDEQPQFLRGNQHGEPHDIEMKHHTTPELNDDDVELLSSKLDISSDDSTPETSPTSTTSSVRLRESSLNGNSNFEVSSQETVVLKQTENCSDADEVSSLIHSAANPIHAARNPVIHSLNIRARRPEQQQQRNDKEKINVVDDELDESNDSSVVPVLGRLSTRVSASTAHSEESCSESGEFEEHDIDGDEDNLFKHFGHEPGERGIGAAVLNLRDLAVVESSVVVGTETNGTEVGSLRTTTTGTVAFETNSAMVVKRSGCDDGKEPHAEKAGNSNEAIVWFVFQESDLVFLSRLPKYQEVLAALPFDLPCVLPPKRSDDERMTLVLDLDETLVHCSIEETTAFDWKFDVDFHGTNYAVSVRTRPHLRHFLAFAAQHFEVVVFTASQRVYAEQVLSKLDPDGTLIEHRLYRESCLFVHGNLLKDLNVLGRDLSKVVIVDNSPYAFGYQVDNGIPITSWFSDDDDTKLMELTWLLGVLNRPSVPDVRPKIRELFGLAGRIDLMCAHIDRINMC